jgi:hypothetical protein
MILHAEFDIKIAVECVQTHRLQTRVSEQSSVKKSIL